MNMNSEFKEHWRKFCERWMTPDGKLKTEDVLVLPNGDEGGNGVVLYHRLDNAPGIGVVEPFLTLDADDALRLAVRIVSLMENHSPLKFAEMLMLHEFPQEEKNLNEYIMTRWGRK